MTLIPVVAFAVVLAVLLLERDRETFRYGAQERTLALLTAVDTELTGSISTVEALAVMPSLRDGDLAYFRKVASRVLQSQADWVNVNLALPSGQQIMNLQVPEGQPLPNIGDLDGSFARLLKNRKAVVSDLAMGPVLKRWSFAVRAPVFGAGGEVRYVLSAGMHPDALARIVMAQQLPAGWVGVVLDRNDRIVARTLEPQESFGKLASQSLRDGLSREQSGWFRGSTIEGAPVYTPFQRSAATGWAFAMGIPAAAVEAAAARTIWALALGVLGALALAIAAAYFITRRISVPIGALASATGALGQGIPVEVPGAMRIAELARLADAMRASGRAIAERQAQIEREQDALRTSEERLRLAMEAGRMGTWQWDIRTGEVLWSAEFEAIHGMPPGAFAGTLAAYEEHIHPEDREAVRLALVRHLKKQDEEHVEYRVIRPDGDTRWLEARAKVYRDGAGLALRQVGICIDVTERKRAEERFRLSLEASPSANVMVDASGKIVLITRQTERLFGYAREELVGQPIEVLVPERFRRHHPLHRGAFAAAPGTRPMGAGRELYGLRRDGTEVPVEIGLNPLEIEGETFVLSAIVDITERKRAEELLREADRHKDEFLATLSHELRNPLAALSSAAHVLKVAEPASGPALKARGVVERQTKHMARLIGDLLDIGRINAGKLGLERERLDLAQVVRGVVDVWRRSGRLERHAVSCSTERAWLDADRARIEQITANLLDNAVKFTPAGGAISLTVSKEEGAAVLRVADRGEGLAVGAAQKIFELFVQGDDVDGGGMGIGLALVKRLAELHGGSVDVSSEGRGHGATFTVRLPAAAEAEGAALEAAAELSRPSQRVLIVEDNDDARQMLEATLALEGHEVRAARNGTAALAFAADCAPDVALIDISLPDMDGYEVARRMRAAAGGRRLGLVAVTGFGQPEDQRRAFEAGFDAHLVKPVSADRLKQVIAALA